jgi:hypothetical protein
LNFVKVLLEKYQQHYTFILDITSSELDYNDKITSDAIELLDILCKKFMESNFISLHIVTIQIALNRELTDKIFQDPESRKSKYALYIQRP